MIQITSNSAGQTIAVGGARMPRGGFLQRQAGNPDPMANIANLVDAMLVLACGLMIAVVTYYQVELPNAQEVVRDDATEVQDVEDVDEWMESVGESYNEVGTLYEDPETGKLYTIEEADGGTAASASGTQTGTAASVGSAAAASNAAAGAATAATNANTSSASSATTASSTATGATATAAADAAAGAGVSSQSTQK